MAGVPIESLLMLAYAISLALIACFLEWIGGHAHRRSLGVSTTGFTYHADRDVWTCPRDQHLFRVFSNPGKRTATYRASASVCNSCPSKPACTDSSEGREIERNTNDVQHGMKTFHHAVSLTLLVLASLILVVELFRTGGFYPRIVLAATLSAFCLVIQRQAVKLSQSAPTS